MLTGVRLGAQLGGRLGVFARCGEPRHTPGGCLVGAAGLEPTTTGTPYRCATKLRHAPTRMQHPASRPL